mgnify:CR=1 FL=1
MDHRDVVEAARAADVRLIRFEYCDVSGVARTKTVHVDTLESKLQEGVGLTRAQMAINLLEQMVPIEGMEPVGELRLVPDPATFTVLPWSPGSASILCDQLDHDRQDWGACTRSYLKSAITRAAERGITVMASFENEYYLAEEVEGGYRPYDLAAHTPVYSVIGQDFHAPVLIDTLDALSAQGMRPEQAINEYGGGQVEIAIRYTDALGAADNQMKYRDTVRGVALQHGLFASLAPRPFPDRIGSGAHIHFSLWSPEGTNLLYDAGGDRGLSALGRAFIGGVTEHLPALLALTCPSANSHRRLQPSAWASNTVSWGFDNRECAIRVASPFWGREAESFNLELKTSDCSANPYLALGGLIMAGLDGIERVEVNWSTQVVAHQAMRGQALLPGVKNIVAVASGKGGVGKSTTAVNLALALAAEGARVGMLDADIYGPSLPLMLGLQGAKPESDDGKTMKPLRAHGLQLNSIGFLVEQDQAMIWRGPMATSALDQLLRQTQWDDLDYLVVDMPPGTGDIQLTLSQKVPVTGAVVVTTPQDIALLDATKGLKMFEKVGVPILGIVENMSVYCCPNCGHSAPIFGAEGGQKMAAKHGVSLLAQMPLSLQIATPWFDETTALRLGHAFQTKTNHHERRPKLP